MDNEKQSVIQQKLPGEFIRLELKGIEGPQFHWTWLFPPFGPTSGEHSTVYLGITAADFVVVDTNLLGRPTNVRRFPLGQVKLVRAKDGLMTDVVEIDVGEAAPITVQMLRGSRERTRQLLRILSDGEQEPGGPRVADFPTVDAPRSGPSDGFWLRSLFGASGALAGMVCGMLLSAFVITSRVPGDVEGLGLVIGMIPLILCVPACLAAALLGAWLGPLIVRARPAWAKMAPFALSLSLTVAMWIVIGLLFSGPVN